ncbi:hypothetical protein V6Z12_D12G083100 [Gossypium hirsutum]
MISWWNMMLCYWIVFLIFFKIYMGKISEKRFKNVMNFQLSMKESMTLKYWKSLGKS